MSTLGFDITARIDSLEKGLNKASSSIEKFSKENEKRFQDFGKGVSDVGKKLSVGLTGSIAVATTAMFALAKNVGDTADRILDLADITGMSTDAIQEYQYVAKQAGVSTEAVSTAVEGLTRRLIATGEEGSKVSQMLNEMGIATSKANGELRNAGDIMDDALKVLSDMENQTERNALGAQMFGGSWKDLAPILSMGSKGIEDARQEARDLGIVLDGDALDGANKFRQATAKLTAQLEGFKNQIGAKLAPVLTNTLIPAIQRHVIPLFQRLGKFIDETIKFFNGLDASTKKVILIVTGLAAALGPVLVAVGALISFLPVLLAGFAAIISPVGLIVAGIVALGVVIVKNIDTIKNWAEKTINYFIRIYNESLVFRAGIELIILNFKNLFNVGKFVFTSLFEIVKLTFNNMKSVISAFLTVLEGVLTWDFATAKRGVKDFSESLKSNITDAVANIVDNGKELFDNLGKDAKKSIDNIMAGKKEPFKFEVAEESTKNLEEKVAQSVANGVAKGLGRATVSGVSELNNTTEASTSETLPIGELFNREEITKNINGITEEMLHFNENLENLIAGSITNTLSQLGTAIGEALATGGSVFKAMGETIIQGFGNFLGELGDMMLQYGAFAKIKGKLDLAVAAGGPASIAAGAAAIGVGVALKAISGAIGSRATSGFGGGGTGATAVGSGATSTFTSSTRGDNEVVFRIRRQELVGVLQRGNNIDNIIGG